MLEVAQVNFIGRKEELNTLEKEFRRDGSFVVIYGRRRIGKTTLIKEFIKDKQAFYFLCDGGSGVPEHEASCRRGSPGHWKFHAAEGHLHGLAGSVP